MDRAVQQHNTDAPAHLVAGASTLLGGATVFGLTPDQWVAVASIATAMGVAASLVMYVIRWRLALREDARRERETQALIEAHSRDGRS